MNKIIFIIIIFINSNLYGEEYNLIFNFSGSYKKNEIIFIILIFITSGLYGKDFDLIFNFSGSYKKNEMIFLDKSSLSHNIYESEWTDNYGNYGTSYCLTSIKYDSKQIIVDLESYCRFKDQDGNIFTQFNTRVGDELNAGSGTAKFIEGQKKWNYLIGAECLYSIRYLENRTFSIRKCKVTEDMNNKFAK